VNVEIKNLQGDGDYDPEDTVAALVVECLGRRGGEDDVLVSSFNLATIDRVRVLDPSVPTGFLTMLGFDPIDALDVCAARGHGALHPFVGMLAGPVAGATVTRAHAQGVAVNVWTVNDDGEIQRLAAAGVDIVMTDVPLSALRALGRTSGE
jgi:glycerophosphoryl diester phosphodiesterase